MTVLLDTSFPGADENPLSTPFTVAVGGFRKTSNQVTTVATNTFSAVADTSNTYPDDHEATVYVATLGQQDFGPAVRVNPSTGACYFLQNANLTDIWVYWTNGGGGYVQVGTIVGEAFQIGDAITLRAIGTDLQVLINGTQVGADIDVTANLITSGNAGMSGYDNANAPGAFRISRFIGADLNVATSVALVTSENDYLTWTSGGGIPQIDSFTFMGWFKPNFGSATSPNFFSIGETGVAGRSIYHDESQFIQWYGSAGTPQGAIADDTWYCIAWRGNGTELKGYRKLSDATVFATWTETQGITLTENNVSVGHWINNTSHWNGEIRAIKGWHVPLSDVEIEAESRQFAPVETTGLLWYVGLSNTSDVTDLSGNGFNPTVVGLANGVTAPTLPPPPSAAPRIVTPICRVSF